MCGVGSEKGRTARPWAPRELGSSGSGQSYPSCSGHGPISHPLSPPGGTRHRQQQARELHTCACTHTLRHFALMMYTPRGPVALPQLLAVLSAVSSASCAMGGLGGSSSISALPPPFSAPVIHSASSPGLSCLLFLVLFDTGEQKAGLR